MPKNVQTIAQLHSSHASKVMFNILQARLQQYVNREFPDVQPGFRKGRGTRDQIANICWIIKKAREFQKNIYFCFIGYAKAFDCVDHNKLWKILQEMRIPDHLTCLLRNLYAGQEPTVKQQEGQAPTERGRETLIQGRVTNCPTLPARDEHAATLPPGCPRSLVRRNVSRRRPGPAGHLPSGP